MSTPGEEVWFWMVQPLQELNLGYKYEPGRPWKERRRLLLGYLRLNQASEHPVIERVLQ